jgi:hypothetical protein
VTAAVEQQVSRGECDSRSGVANPEEWAGQRQFLGGDFLCAPSQTRLHVSPVSTANGPRVLQAAFFGGTEASKCYCPLSQVSL